MISGFKRERGKPTTKSKAHCCPSEPVELSLWGIFFGIWLPSEVLIQWFPCFPSTLHNPSPLNSWDKAAPSGSLPKGWRYHLAPSEAKVSPLPLHLDGNLGFVPLQSFIYIWYFPTFSTYVYIHLLMISYFCSPIDATWMSEKYGSLGKWRCMIIWNW